MENTIFSPEEAYILEAKKCLEKNDSEIDFIVDAWRGDYYSARLSILMKHMKISEPEAERLLKQLDKEPSDSIRRIQETRKIVNEIQKDPYDMLVDQLVFEYECFCRRNDLYTDHSIPEHLKSTIIFTFHADWGKDQWVPLWLARFLLKSGKKTMCREFFISATRGSML